MKPARLLILPFLLVSAWACGHGGANPAVPPRSERTLAVWAGAQGFDELTLKELAHAGVDRLVVGLGSVSLAGNVPVLRGLPVPKVPPGLPVALLFRLQPAGGKLDPKLASAVWRAVEEQAAGLPRPELVEVDLARLAERTDEFLAELEQAARVPVVPVVAPSQLSDPLLPAVAAAAHRVLVMADGDVAAWRAGEQPLPLPWDEALAPLARTGVSWRLGVVLTPRAKPELGGWGEDLDPLTEPETADVLTSSSLDRSFRFRRAVDWSGRSWRSGTTVALSWVDAAQLDGAFRRAEKVSVPPLDGWDLVPLPPPAPALGISREALAAYLRGEGPAPTPKLNVEKVGRSLRIELANPTPFSSAVSRFGNWVEVHAEHGVVAERRGGFDAVASGRGTGRKFEHAAGERADTVRLYEFYLAPGENVAAARLRLRSSRDRAVVRWHLLLSDGREITGGP